MVGADEVEKGRYYWFSPRSKHLIALVVSIGKDRGVKIKAINVSSGAIVNWRVGMVRVFGNKLTVEELLTAKVAIIKGFERSLDRFFHPRPRKRR